MQETKLADDDAPVEAFRDGGLRAGPPRRGALERRGDRQPRAASTDVVTNFGEPLRPRADPRRRRRRAARRGAHDRGDVRRRSRREPLRAQRPRRRLAVLRGQARLVRAARALAARSARARGAAGDRRRLQRRARRTPTSGIRAACHGGTHVSTAEREAFARALRGGAWSTPTGCTTRSPSRYTWWDYRAGDFHKNFGMRIDHLLATRAVADRVVWAEIDREARKGKPIPSDHAPLIVDLDEPGHPFDAGWGPPTSGSPRGARSRRAPPVSPLHLARRRSVALVLLACAQLGLRGAHVVEHDVHHERRVSIAGGKEEQDREARDSRGSGTASRSASAALRRRSWRRDQARW